MALPNAILINQFRAESPAADKSKKHVDLVFPLSGAEPGTTSITKQSSSRRAFLDHQAAECGLVLSELRVSYRR